RIRVGLGVAAAMLIGVSIAQAQERAAQSYLSVLSEERASVLDDGRVVISMVAAGDLRGMLTVVLTQDGASYKGEWSFVAQYVQDLRADGSVIDLADHVGHDHEEGASTLATHREYLQFKFDGTLHGKLEGATVRRAADGRVYALENAALLLTGGTRDYN